MTRLIDAEALLKEFCKKQKEFAPWDYDPIEIIDSAPTVETTDDVLAKLPEIIRDGIKLEFGWDELNQKWYAGYFDKFQLAQMSEIGFGKTPLEAVKNLEAFIKSK